MKAQRRAITSVLSQASGRSAKTLAHLGGRLEVVLRRQAAAVGIGDMRALGDAEQRVVRLVHRGLGEMHVVGRDQRQAACIGEIEQRRLDAPLALLAVALQLDIEPAVEQRLQPLEHGGVAAGAWPAASSRPTPLPGAAGEGQQAVGMAFQLGRAAAPASEPVLNSRWARLTSRIRLR